MRPFSPLRSKWNGRRDGGLVVLLFDSAFLPSSTAGRGDSVPERCVSHATPSSHMPSVRTTVVPAARLSS